MPPTKHNWAQLVAECERQLAAGELLVNIQHQFASMGINWNTFKHHRTASRKTPQEPSMSDTAVTAETPPDVPQDAVQESPMPDPSVTIETPPDVPQDAVGAFLPLPEGYAATIQPMRAYNPAEEYALSESMRRYGFLGSIVKDQYGRTIDGHHREKEAHEQGLHVPVSIVQVRDDAHALELARVLNLVRRHVYTLEQREEMANLLRDQGFSYQLIAEALGISKAAVGRTLIRSGDGTVGGSETPQDPEQTTPPKRITGKDGKTYTIRQPTAAPKSAEPEPRRPSRMAVQERLVAWMKLARDRDAWPVLATLWLSLKQLYTQEKAPELHQAADDLLAMFPPEVVDSFQLRVPLETTGH
jgi:uncharacterized protein YerC